jgi:hypothetical protein
MINGFNEIKPATAAETDELNRYKGDAYWVRAYYYNELMQRFSKAYNPTTAANDLGVPLVLTYDVTEMPSRASAKAVYDQIMSDLNQAKTLLVKVNGAQGSPRITKDAVTALEARVRLNMQDWAGAKAAAEAVITSSAYPLINTATAFKAYWHTDTKTESILQLRVIAPNEFTNGMGVYLGYVPAIRRFTPDFIPSQWVVDMYDSTDIRKGTYFERLPVTIQGANYNNVWLVNKYPGNPTHFTGANTNYQHEPKVLRIAEMYLISAEASARLGSADALTRLNQLRTARGVAQFVGLSGTALMNAVMEERTRELAFEGFRLFDLKRWNLGFTRRQPQNTNMLTSGPEYFTLSIAAGNPKFTWAIPANDITINRNLVQNPGW